MSEAIEKTIDIDRILKGKMGAKAKLAAKITQLF